MEFEGAGIMSMEPPHDDLRPFFIRKFRTMFRYIIVFLSVNGDN